MNENLVILFSLFGGLAIFIFGMNMMSECLQKAAGDKMRKILSFLTKNPVMGVLAGALTTAVLQSSSATTVMTIGFVSAGLMNLPQAISVILGANIGTTMTAQIIAFKVTDYIYLFIALGFIVAFVSKREKIKNLGQTLFAFGLLFEGIEIMGSVMKPLAGSPVFINMIKSVSDIPVLGVLVGTLMTLVVQSSSATIAVLQNFAAQPLPSTTDSVIGLTGAIPVLLGDNIGTTITALLASIGQSKDSKRTAIAHSVFNISGAFLFIWFIKPYASLIQSISPKGPEIDVISRQIANAHTGFNLTMTLIWLPFIPVLVKIVMWIIPDKKDNYVLSPGAFKYLDERLINQPATALHLATKEMIRCGEKVNELLSGFCTIIDNDENQLLPYIKEKTENIRELFRGINDYMSAIFSEGVITEEQAGKSTRILNISCDLGRMSDLCKEITELIHGNDGTIIISKEAKKDLRKSVKQIRDMYEFALQIIETGNEDDKVSKSLLEKRKDQVLDLDDKMRKSHIDRVGKKKCNANLTMRFNEIIHDIDRMGHCCVNLVDMATDEAGIGLLIDYGSDHENEGKSE